MKWGITTGLLEITGESQLQFFCPAMKPLPRYVCYSQADLCSCVLGWTKLSYGVDRASEDVRKWEKRSHTETFVNTADFKVPEL